MDALQVRARRILRSHRQRAKKDGAKLDYGLSEIQELLAKCLCEYCLLPVSYSIQIDYARPISRGGTHCLDNLVLSCSRCNQLKGQLTKEEFIQLLDLLSKLYPAARQDIERRLLAGGRRYR